MTALKHNQLALDILARLPGENRATAPTTIAAALHLLRRASAGAARAELTALLGDEMPSTQGLESTTAGCGLFAHTALPLDFDFQVDMAAQGVEVSSMDMTDQSAAPVLNRWVSDRTAGKVADLFTADQFGPLTRAVLVAAAAFCGTWSMAFQPARPLPFCGPNGYYDVPTMRLKTRLRYVIQDPGRERLGTDHGGFAVEIPYTDGRTAMVVTMGRPSDPPMSASRFDALRAAMTVGEVEVLLPRFDIAAVPRDLMSMLRDLGLQNTLGPEPDFSAMTTDRLRISAVQHAAYMRVDERGTEAGGAAGAVMVYRGRAPRVPFLAFDHAFNAHVVDTADGRILFSAAVGAP